jgi:hypothetical protein
VTAPATSVDTAYDTWDAPDVVVTNIDDETAGAEVVTSGTQTTETGTSVTFTVVLRSQPIADVTLPISSSDISEGTVSPSSLTFTTADWYVPQQVTVTGADDGAGDGGQNYTVLIGPASSTDPAYNGLDPVDLLMTNLDDEPSLNSTAGITVGAASGATTERSGTATFTVVLNSEPTANVSIGLSSSDTTEGTVDAATLTFTSGDWSIPKTVVVTGVDDSEADGHQTYNIVTAPAVSNDADYSGMDAADVALTNIDDDGVPPALPQLTFPSDAPAGVTPQTGSAGDTFTFSVDYTSALDKAPVIAELWIDLDGDGAYNTVPPAAAITRVAPPPRGGGTGAPAWALSAQAAGLALLLAALLSLRGRYPALAPAGASLAVGLAVMVALLGCGGGGGGTEPAITTDEPQENPGTEEPTGSTSSAVQEVYTLVSALTNDGVFTDGESYAVSLTIDTAGSYTYRFVFYDDTHPAFGLPTANQTLAVQ